MTPELVTLIGVAAAPTLTVLLGIFLNAQGLRDIRTESRADRSELSAKIEQLGKDLSAKIDKHEAKTQERLDRFFEKITEQDSRLHRLEDH